jgi:hypothetical protein
VVKIVEDRCEVVNRNKNGRPYEAQLTSARPTKFSCPEDRDRFVKERERKGSSF